MIEREHHQDERNQAPAASPEDFKVPAVDNETKQYLREQFNKIDFSKYVEEKPGSKEAPIRFLKNKENENDRILRVIYPGSEYPVVVKIPEKSDLPSELAESIQTWEDIENKVMLDETTLWVLSNILVRYN